MAKLTAADINELHAAYVADPSREADHFWSAVLDWVIRCDYIVPSSHKDDLVQNTIVALMTNLDRFKPGTDFVKWMNAIIRNKRMDCFSDNFYDRDEVSFCELAQVNEEGEVVEFDPSTIIDGKDDPSDMMPKGDREDAATTSLDSLRANFKKQADRDLLDLLRSGCSLQEAADAMGGSYGTIQRRFARWKNKVRRNVSDLRNLEIVITEGYLLPLAA
jgi:RNA polymerase sigma factor (sigma-70 family)